MIISVASGKGGTGKTTVATNFAGSLPQAQILDCDVEEPNSHIFIKPEIHKQEAVYISVPEVDHGQCTHCGKCQQVCAYNAIAVLKEKTMVFAELCHGCGSCAYFCPSGALKEQKKRIGVVEIGRSGDLQFIHGRLDIGQAMAPPLIRAVKNYINPTRVAVIDAPPGTSCPVIESIKGSDYCLLVTEPTPFGLNDLTLAVEVLRNLSIPFGVVINRSDLGDDKTEQYCEKEKIPVLLRIPFERKIAESYSRGETIIEAFPEYKKKFQGIFKMIAEGI
ncbi:MAG: 4Fe-4S dicluster domain-containing protein [Candidatus Omnitrophota bacterium]